MADGSSWALTFDADSYAWLTCDVPGSSTNVLSAQVMHDLQTRLAEIRSCAPRGLVLRSGKQSGFIAGADVHEFLGIRTAAEGYALVRSGQAVIQQVEDLPCPSVAALHGFVLGGGLELALACTYRIGADEPGLSLGLPEVLLGIHPGFGGTVRAVRVVGARAALELMLKGRPFRGPRALAVGLVDELVPRADLDARARELLARRPAPHRARLLDRLLNLRALRCVLAKRTATSVRKAAPREHYPAPYAMLRLWQQYGAQGTAAFEAEARSISELLITRTSRNLVRVFLLQDRLKAFGQASQAVFAHLHVIGAGTMGGDIAAWAALRGLTVTLQDRSEELVRPAIARARSLFEKRLKDPLEASAAIARLRMDIEGRGVAEADVILEAIFENIEAKRALYAQLEPRLKPGALLATNTSSIMIEKLSEHLSEPARLVGIHFFNPVAQLQLVEVVRGRNTGEKALQDALHFTRRLDKLPLPCASAPGFVVNRILTPYINEALFALEAGLPREVVDRAAVRFGMPIGPVELCDVVGLDVALQVGRVLSAAFGRPIPSSLSERVEQRKLGRKTGEGFYHWRDGKPVRAPATDAQIPAELEDRLILPMLNEAVAVLREGTIEDADLIDAGAVFATGFAPFRGGPLQYAKERGVEDIRRVLKDLEGRYGARFRPDPGWDRLSP